MSKWLKELKEWSSSKNPLSFEDRRNNKRIGKHNSDGEKQENHWIKEALKFL